MAKTFFIKKAAGKEVTTVFRLTSPESIPEHLRSSVTFCEDGRILIANVDNKVTYTEEAKLGVVIAYETTTDEHLPNGWNMWVKSNAAETLEERDGKFYQKPAIVEAQFVSDEFPEFIRGAKITHNSDGSWSLDCGWAVVSGNIGDIWAKYGVKNGVVDANIIAVKQTDTINQYYHCTATGEIIETLAEYLTFCK